MQTLQPPCLLPYSINQFVTASCHDDMLLQQHGGKVRLNSQQCLQVACTPAALPERYCWLLLRLSPFLMLQRKDRNKQYKDQRSAVLCCQCDEQFSAYMSAPCRAAAATAAAAAAAAALVLLLLLLCVWQPPQAHDQ
jgi:hypothetical protein